LLIASPVILPFIYLDKLDQGLGTWACAAILVVITRVHWDVRKSPWFWIAMMALLPFGLLDYFIVDRCIKLAEKFANKKLPPPSV
jgi:hypothetical protein